MGFPFFLNYYSLFILYLAVIFDVIFGDGNYSFHPVRLIGSLISFAEKRARASMLPLKLAGAIIVIILVGGFFLSFFFFFSFLKNYSIYLYVFLSAVIIYFCLCLRCLGEEAMKVFWLLNRGKINSARRQLSFLVSRDTADMDIHDISRSTVETVAENFVDGVISPFFYASIFGPSITIAFKIASTLDSMIGYKTDEYKELGFFSAKLDDFFNYLPARICVFFIFLAGFLFYGKNPIFLFRQAKRYFSLSESPNSGYPEAAFAIVLGVRIGGATRYHGKVKKLPFINEDGQIPEPSHIKSAVNLMYQSSFLFFIAPFFLYIIFKP